MKPTARRLQSGCQLVAEVRPHVLDVRCALLEGSCEPLVADCVCTLADVAELMAVSHVRGSD